MTAAPTARLPRPGTHLCVSPPTARLATELMKRRENLRMTNVHMLCYLSYRASRWVGAMTADPDIRQAPADENLKRKVRIGKGPRVYFKLTHLQAEQTINLLEELERLRVGQTAGRRRRPRPRDLHQRHH